MKTFLSVLLLGALVAAEPPRYRQTRYRSEKQEFAPNAEEREQTTPRHEEAPYPASGFRPPKAFELPARQEISPPATSYGVPENSYNTPLFAFSAPQTEYGVPFKQESNVREAKEEKKDVEERSSKLKSEKKSEKKESLKETLDDDAEVVSARGAYYVLLPDSNLQRVQFQTENDVRNMAYTARLQYKNEDRAPIFVYTASLPQYQPNAAYVQLV